MSPLSLCRILSFPFSSYLYGIECLSSTDVEIGWLAYVLVVQMEII